MAQQYDFNAGVDISALTSITQAQLMQMVQQIAPLSNIGGILYQSTTPDVANNARFARYIWLDSTTAPPVAKYYNGASWTAVAVSALSITNAEVSATAAIAVTKLAPGTARYVLRTNAAGTANEFVTPASALNSNELGVIKLTAAGSDSYLKTVSGVSQWVDQTTERAAIASALSNLSPTVRAPGSNNTLLGTNGSGVVGFAAIGSLLANNAIGLNLLAVGGATTGQFLRFDGSAWGPLSLGLTKASGALTSDALANASLETLAHGLGTAPKNVAFFLVNNTGGAVDGWSNAEEVPAYAVLASDNLPLFTWYADATNVYVRMRDVANLELINKSTGVYGTTASPLTGWFVRAYAFA